MDKNEISTHKLLSSVGLRPKGHIIKETIYGTFLVPDNFFCYNGSDWYVFVQSPQSLRYETIRSHFCKSLANCFIVKNMIDGNAKCIIILFCDNDVELGNHMFAKLLKKYSDLFLINPRLRT